MSRRKGGGTEAWRKHTGFDPFANNPQNNRFFINERFYIRLLQEWATTRFRWVNLPEEIDPRFVESNLFYNAFVLFYNDWNFDKFMAVRGMAAGPINMYDNPTRFRTVAVGNYESVDLHSPTPGADEDSKDIAVPIWGSYSRIPARDIVLHYSRRLADLDMSLEINAKALRHNRVVKVEESQRLTMVNMMRQVDQGQPVIYGSPGLNLDAIEALDIGTNPANLSALRMERNEVWNDAMTALGITNSNQNKKERLVAAEATGTDGQVLAARNSAMKPRQEAADAINRIFGLNVEVVWDMEEDVMPEVGQSPRDAEDEAHDSEEVL